MAENIKKLYRSRTNKVIAGVCGGLGKYFDVDPVIFRILFVIFTFVPPGVGILIYIIMIFVIPLEPGENEITQKEEVKQIAENVKEKAQRIASEFKEKKNNNPDFWQSPRNLIGLVLVIIGVLFMIGQIFPFTFFRWAFIWPTLIILIGLYLLLKSTSK